MSSATTQVAYDLHGNVWVSVLRASTRALLLRFPLRASAAWELGDLLKQAAKHAEQAGTVANG